MSILWTFSLIISYLQLYFLRFSSEKSTNFGRSFPSFHPIESVSNSTIVDDLIRPVCVITGATSGLGAAAVKSLSMRGFYVVLVGRSSESLAKIVADIKKKKKKVIAPVKAFVVDVSSMLATNYIGAFCLTKVLLPLLENSHVPSFFEAQMDKETVTGKCFSSLKSYPFAHIYEYSKFCLLLFSYELHRQVGFMEKSRHVSVIAVDPGVVKTHIMRELPASITWIAFFTLKVLGMLQSPENGVSAILDAALAGPEISGVYFFGGNMNTSKSSAFSYNTKLSKDLWATSCDIFLESQLAYNGASS